jgi:preprotein translocase subunit SecG
MKRSTQIFLLIFFIIALQLSYAQTPPPPPDGGGGDGTVTDTLPINLLVYPFLVIGVLMGYLFSKKS